MDNKLCGKKSTAKISKPFTDGVYKVCVSQLTVGYLDILNMSQVRFINRKYIGRRPACKVAGPSHL